MDSQKKCRKCRRLWNRLESNDKCYVRLTELMFLEADIVLGVPCL